MLPHVLRYTIRECFNAQNQVLSIFNETLGWGEAQAGDAVARFVCLLGLPSTLTAVGVTDEQTIQRVAHNTLSDILAGNQNIPDFDGLKHILNMAR